MTEPTTGSQYLLNVFPFGRVQDQNLSPILLAALGGYGFFQFREHGSGVLDPGLPISRMIRFAIQAVLCNLLLQLQWLLSFPSRIQ